MWRTSISLGWNIITTHPIDLYVVGGTASANKARVWVAGGSTGFAGISTPTTTLSVDGRCSLLVSTMDMLKSMWMERLDGSSAWYHPGLGCNVSGLAIGRGTADAGPDATFDEATFSTVTTHGRLVTCQLQQPKAQLHLPELWLAAWPNQLGRSGLHRNLRKEGYHHYFLHRGPFG